MKKNHLEKIYIDLQDEITQVIDKLSNLENKEILLIAPVGAHILKSVVNLRLLKKEAGRLKQTIHFVTSDMAGLRLAKKAGFSAGKDPEEFAKKEEEKEEKKHYVHRQESRSVRMSDIVHKSQVPIVSENAKIDLREGAENEKPQKEKKKKGAATVVDLTTDQEEEIFENDAETEAKKVIEDKFPLLDDDNEFKKKISGKFPDTVSLSVEKSFNYKMFVAIIGVLCVVVLIVIAWLVLPKAEITLDPVDRDLEMEISVSADTHISQVNAANNQMPAQFVRIEKEAVRNFPATGEKKLNEKSKGMITIYNEYSSTAQSLVETTRLISEDTNKLFRITKSITIPGAKIEDGKIVPSSIEVEVVADQPGNGYNIGPSKFVIPGFKGTPKFDAFYGKSKTAMTGGSTDTVKIVKKEDIDKAQESMIGELKSQTENELKSQIPAGLIALGNAVNTRVAEAVSSVEAEGHADQFSLKLKMVSEVIVFNEDYLKQLIEENVAKKINGEEKSLPATLKIEYVKTENDFEKGVIKLVINAKEKIVAKVDATKAAEELKGKNEAGVREILGGNNKVEAAKVSFWPFWVKKVPSQNDKIFIKVLDE